MGKFDKLAKVLGKVTVLPTAQELKEAELAAKKFGKVTVKPTAQEMTEAASRAGTKALIGLGAGGPASMGSGNFDPAETLTDLGSKLKGAYNSFKENVQYPVADVIMKGLRQPSNAPAFMQTGYEKSESAPELQAPINAGEETVGRMVFDPGNILPGAGQAIQFGLEMLPEEKAKKDALDKLIKAGY